MITFACSVFKTFSLHKCPNPIDRGYGFIVDSERVTGDNFEPFIGSITFARTLAFSFTWFFDSTPETSDDIPPNTVDFFSTANHELGHVLGIGTKDSDTIWNNPNVLTLSGPNVLKVNNNQPLPIDKVYWGHILDDPTILDENGLLPLMTQRGGAVLAAFLPSLTWRF